MSDLSTTTLLCHAEYGHWWFQSRRTIRERVFWNDLPSKDLTILCYYNFFLFPAAFLARKADASFAAQMMVPTPWKNSLLRKIFSSEKYLLPWISFPVGVSLLAIYQKE